MRKNLKKPSQMPYNKILLVGLMFIISLFSINLVLAISNFTDEYIDTASCSNGIGYYEGFSGGQKYQSTRTGTINKIGFYYKNTAGLGNCMIYLNNSDGAGQPLTGVGSQVWTPSNNQVQVENCDDMIWTNVTFSVPPQVVAGNNYSILIRCPSSLGGGPWFIWGSDLTSPTWANAFRIYSANFINWNAATTHDHFMSIYGSTQDNIVVTLISPTNGVSISANNRTTFIVNHTGDSFSLKNTTYTIWFTNSTLLNQTTYDINSSNTTKQGFTIPFGNFLWNAYTCGENATGTLCAWQETNFTFDAGASILGYSYPENVSETESITFSLNISVIAGANLFAARLNYNGTRYFATKTLTDTIQYTLSRTIDIPLLSSSTPQNVSFYWEFEYKNGMTGNQNSSTYIQTVNPLFFYKCNATQSTIFWNITTANETTRNFIPSILDGTFRYFIGSGTVIKNYSLDSTNTDYNYTFCGNRAINVSSIINVKSDNFHERTFYFNKFKLNNIMTNTTLYLQDSGSSIIVEVTDIGLVQQEGIFVNVYRYYSEINNYLIVEKAKTDEFGQFVARLIEPNTIKYQFEFLDSDNNILKRTGDMTIACRTSICVIPFVIEDTTDDFNRLGNVSNFDYSLSFNNNTNIFTYTWNDVTGDSITNRLLVERVQFNGTTIVSGCNASSTALSGSITCDVGSSKAKYRAQAFRKIDGKLERRIIILNIEVGSTVRTFGLEGLFWAFILLFTCIGVGAYNPTVGALLYGVGFLALGVLGVISMPIEIFFANTILTVLLIWSIRT